MIVNERLERLQRRGPARRESVLVALAVLALAAAHLAVAAAFGAFGVTRNDDWVYYRSAFAFAEGRGFAPDPYTSAMLVGLVALARPVISIFGEAMGPLQVLVAVLGAVGLWASWWTARQFLTPRLALLAAATLGLGPWWGILTVSFMTDVPAFAFEAVSVALGVRALRGGRLSWPWLLGAIVTSLAAFSIREYAVASLAAVGLTAFLMTDGREPHGARRQRVLVLVAVALSFIAAAALYRWRGAQTTGAAERSLILRPGLDEARTVVRTVFTLGLLMAPALVVCAPKGLADLVRRRWVISLVVLAALLAGAAFLRGDILLGNLVTSRGSYPETLTGDPVRVVPQVVWLALVGAAVIGATLLVMSAGHVAHRHRGSWTSVARRTSRLDPALVSSAAFAVAVVSSALGVAVVLHLRLFDRYLLPAVPFAAALLLHQWAQRPTAGTLPRREVSSRGGRRRSTVATVSTTATAMTLAFFTLVSVVYVMASAALDGAAWHAGERASAKALPAATVDAGLGWFGVHQQAPIVFHPDNASEWSPWVSVLFARPVVCAVASWAPPDSEASDPTLFVPPVQVRVPLGPSYDVVVHRANLRCDH